MWRNGQFFWPSWSLHICIWGSRPREWPKQESSGCFMCCNLKHHNHYCSDIVHTVFTHIHTNSIGSLFCNGISKEKEKKKSNTIQDSAQVNFHPETLRKYQLAWDVCGRWVLHLPCVGARSIAVPGCSGCGYNRRNNGDFWQQNWFQEANTSGFSFLLSPQVTF